MSTRTETKLPENTLEQPQNMEGRNESGSGKNDGKKSNERSPTETPNIVASSTGPTPQDQVNIGLSF